jgi:hypothetical protein
VQGSDWMLMKAWSLSLSWSQLRPYGLYASSGPYVPDLHHTVLSSRQQNSAIGRETQLLDKICMLSL